jgi:hypothetical protein
MFNVPHSQRQNGNHRIRILRQQNKGYASLTIVFQVIAAK